MTPKSLASVLGFALLAASTALATPDSSSMSFGVSASSVGNSFTATNSDNASWTGTPTVLSASADASSFDNFGAQTHVFASGISAIAADGNSGMVDMSFGWYAADATSVLTNTARPDWTYTFTSDVTGVFNLNFNVTGVTPANEPNPGLFGLQGWYVSDNFDTFLGTTNGSAFDPSASGSLSAGVTQGQTYTISLANNGNISSGSLYQSGYAYGHFAFDITGTSNSVPDDGSTLLLVGVTAVGILLVGSRFRFVRS